MLDRDTIQRLLMAPPVDLAAKVAATVGRGKIPTQQVATECGVTEQAVNNWRKNGRIDKRHIKKLAQLTGLPAEWWLPGFSSHDQASNTPWPFERWIPYSRIQQVDREDLAYIAHSIQVALNDIEGRDIKRNASSKT